MCGSHTTTHPLWVFTFFFDGLLLGFDLSLKDNMASMATPMATSVLMAMAISGSISISMSVSVSIDTKQQWEDVGLITA